MGKVQKRNQKIKIIDLLGLDSNDLDDQSFLAFYDLLAGLQATLIRKGISKNELAGRLKVSRQAIYDKFSGRNVTLGWIQKACDAIGVLIRVAIIDKKSNKKRAA